GPEGHTEHVHQFFRYEVVPAGLEMIAVATGTDREAIAKAIHEYFGSLGGEMVRLTERQARYLGRLFVSETKKAGKDISEYESALRILTNVPVVLSLVEKATLMRKLCVDIKTDYGVVNYYLMRCFSADREGASLLEADKSFYDEVWKGGPADLLRNTVEDFEQPAEDGARVYLNESIVTDASGNLLVLSEVHVKDGRVVSAKATRSQRISLLESAMILSVPEYVTYYDILKDDKKPLRARLEALSGRGMPFKHAAGELFMSMNPDNDHVEKKNFAISGDIFAVFFITGASQLLVVSRDEDSISFAESLMYDLVKDGTLGGTERYTFPEPVLADFIDSDYDDFIEFLDDTEDDDY
ncbi:MAG: hypothetical protein II689_00195, partial [Firmicutes bacterium]|nr:hypothetical protein [Bacillota bacterium]